MRHQKPRFCVKIEPLEVRSLLSASLYYAPDGSGNNLTHTTWGSTGSDLLHTAPVAYGDVISSMAGDNRPNARQLSNVLATQVVDPEPNSRNMSDMIYAWGQFIDHDLDFTPEGSTEYDPITIPSDDTVFTPGSQMPFFRSAYDPTTGTSTTNPRQDPSTVTSYLDASMVYGSDPTRAAALRTFVGGQMKTSTGDLLPINTDNLPENVDIPGTDPTTLYAAGDIRANENSELTSLQVLFLREHNYQATQLAQQHPDWTDEQLYQGARQIVIAEIQQITFDEFLPALLGTKAVTSYTGYNSKVNPDISAEFSEAAYRVGHSLVNGNIDFFADDGSESHDPLDFNASADNPAVLQGGPIWDGAQVDNILKYLVADNAQEVDHHFEDALRNQLFAPSDPSVGGLDLYAIDVERGRDVGLADYNTERAAYGLPKVKSFDQMTSNKQLAAQLRQLYGTTTDAKGHVHDNVNDVDLFVGGLSEDHVSGGSVGPLFTRIIANQFEHIRDGDRLWYQRTLHGSALQTINNTTLSDIIARNTTMTNLQSDAFFFTTGTISGKVSVGKTGAAAVSVTLLDNSGNVLARTKTSGTGTYHFDNQPQGASYQVKVTSLFANSAEQNVVLADNSGAGEFDVDFLRQRGTKWQALPISA